jgi:hypothetical protein
MSSAQIQHLAADLGGERGEIAMPLNALPVTRA